MSEINKKEILHILKWQCITCNIYEEIGKGTNCMDCPFCKNSATKKGTPSRIGLKQSVFIPLGLTKKQCQNWGKCQLFMYLYYPKLNWTSPNIPNYDNYGKKVNIERAKLTIHHINGNHNDDRKDNLTWKLQSDHIKDEQLNFKYKKYLRESTIKCALSIGLKVKS